MSDNFLGRVRVASPCPMQWEDMDGDERVRHCGDCKKNVYNLSSMTQSEAEALLRENDDICGAFYRRPDGTILTSDCPVGHQAKKARRKKTLTRALALVVVGSSALVSWVLVSRSAQKEAPENDIDKAIHAGLKPIRDLLHPQDRFDDMILGAICVEPLVEPIPMPQIPEVSLPDEENESQE